MHYFPSSEGFSLAKRHLTHHRMRRSFSRNPALVSCQTSSLLSSSERRQLCGEYLAGPRSLRLLQLMEIWTWQLPGEKLETYCHSSLICFFFFFFFCAVSEVIIVIPVNFTQGQKRINHPQTTPRCSAATPESLRCIQPRL